MTTVPTQPTNLKTSVLASLNYKWYTFLKGVYVAKEKFEWSGHFQEAEMQAQAIDDVAECMVDFTQRASLELEPLYVSPDIVARIKAAGLEIRGTCYFYGLFSKNEEITPEERVKSVFIGAVAHGRVGLASEAYGLIAASSKVDRKETHLDLIDRLNEFIELEQANIKVGDSVDRLYRMEAAAKALGKPRYHRIMGSVTTGIAMHSR